MAYISDYTCLRCDKPRNEVVPHDHICWECRKTEADQKRRVHFAGLQGLTIEERLARIERELYDTDAKARLDRLDALNARY